jgi:hypothetical protein
MVILVFALVASIWSRFSLRPSPKLFGKCYTLVANLTTLLLGKMIQTQYYSSPAHARSRTGIFHLGSIVTVFSLSLLRLDYCRDL